MRKTRSNHRDEPSDEMEVSDLHQDSPEPATEGTAEEVQWTWKRKSTRRPRLRIKLYSRRSIVDQIAKELKLIGDGVYEELINSCFGLLMRFDTQGFVSNAALQWLFTREVIKADAGPEELWYRVGGRFIRFSKYEYALVTGLSFGPTSFDPCANHDPPATGLFLRHYQGRNLTMNDLRSNFINGVFRRSPADALKVAKLLIVYFLLFGLDGRRTYIDEWAWTLIEDSDGWETFMWGKYTYQILLKYLKRITTEQLNSKESSYHVYGFAWAFLFWAFEAVPELGITCGVRSSDDVLPRFLRWRFPETQVDMEGFSNCQMEVHSTLEPSEEEQRQPYWEHMIHDDLRSNVYYIDLDNTMHVNPPSGDVLPVCRPQGSEASPTRRLCSSSASPMTRKRKRTDPQGNDIQKELLLVRQELTLVQRKLPSVIRQEVHLALKEISSRRDNPDVRDPTLGMQSDEAEVGTCVVPKECEKCKCVGTMAVTMGKEIEDLRREKMAAIKTIEEFKLKQLKADKVVEELKRKNLEANKAVGLSNAAVNKAGEKINELKNQNLENERLVGVVQEKCKHFDTVVVEMGKEIDELRHEKLTAIKSVNELRLKQLEADKVVEELKCKNLEANLKKLESDKAVELYKSSLEKLKHEKLAAAKSIEELRTKQLKSDNDVEELNRKNLEANLKKLESDKAVELYKSRLENLKRENLAATKTIEELRIKQLESDKVVEELKRNNLEANLKTVELYKMESDKAVELYKRRLENLSPNIMETEVGDLSNLVNDVRMLTTSEEGRDLNTPGFNGSTPDNAKSAVDMSRWVRLTSNATGSRGSGLSKEGDRNSVQPLTRKNDDAHIVENSHGTQSCCNPPDTVEANEHRETQASASGNISTEFNVLNDEVSAENPEDELCTDSRMDDLTASLRNERKWMSEADMLQAFQHDEVLCMNAVCALYRHKIVARKSMRCSKNGRFSPVDPMRGCALAEYLINGDRELKLTKSVSEVKKERPDVIVQCRKLATVYVQKLFEIYCAAEDPFFGLS